jgi:hypothetical protein
VRNKLFNIYFEENPLILLDGIPISDASKLLPGSRKSGGLKLLRTGTILAHLFWIA